MTRTCHRVVLSAAAAFFIPFPLYAREAHFVAGSTSAWTEIQGVNGPILAPNSTFSYPYLPFAYSSTPSSLTTLLGVASDGTNGYFLVSAYNYATSTPSEAIWTYNLATGARTATTALQHPAGHPGLTDIALLNDTLYAVSGPASTTYPPSNGTTRIYSIAPSGALNTVYSRTDANAATPQIAANSQSNRVALLPTGGPNYSPSSTTTPQVLIDPSNWSVAQSVAGTAAAQISFNLDGSRLTEYSVSGSLAFANTYAVPGFTNVSPSPTSFGQAGGSGNAVSDAFDYAYPSISPAAVQLSQQVSGGRLFRTGQHSWQTSITVRNYALPDTTSVDQVTVTNLTWTQTSGPAVQTSNTLSPAGPIAVNGTLAQTSFTVDATGTARGVYSLKGAATLQGHYTAPGIDATRPLTTVGASPTTSFAVDPVSDNFVGNGDLELGNYGWTRGSSYNFDTGSSALFFPTTPSSPYHNSQSLELGTPQSPMILSFDYNLDSNLYKSLGDTVDLTVTLAGIQVAVVPGIAGSSGYQHFSVYLSDPQLQGLANPLLDFQSTDKGKYVSYLFVDNVRLIAVPEPATFSLTVLGAFPLFHRRRR